MKKNSTSFLSKASVFILISIAVFSGAWAQTHTAYTQRINGNCNGYWIYRPAGFSTYTGQYPVIFYIPSRAAIGSGSSSSLQKVLNEGVPYYINQKRFPASFTVNGQTSSFVVISPQFIGNPTAADVKAVLDYFMAGNNKIDPQRIYLTGYSVGGDAAFKYPATGLTAARRLAATVPGAAYNNPYTDAGAQYIAEANLPTLAVHSNDDQTIRVGYSQSFIDKINSYKPAVPAKIWRFSGYPHGTAWQVMYDPNWRAFGMSVYEWMLQYRLGSNPPPSNQLPVSNAGSDRTITLPANSVQLNGSGTDQDGSVVSYSWSKISGPSSYTFSNTAVSNPTVSNLVAGSYVFRLTVTDDDGSLGSDDVTITVQPAGNQLPSVNAGNDQSVTEPSNSVTLSGTANDPDGSIASWRWAKVSGPQQVTINNPSAAQTLVSNLEVGTYVFSLTVTDNSGGTASDQVQVTVYPTPDGSMKTLNVNLYGGTNPYNNTQWNNWNLGTTNRNNITSASFKYADGTASGITATLSHSQGTMDNYGGYGPGMAPAEVLRYANHSTQNRTLRISGLSPVKKYSIALYCSRRAGGSETIFIINGISRTIDPYFNYDNAAGFDNLYPDQSGTLQISISKSSTYNYINGFSIIENPSSATVARSATVENRLPSSSLSVAGQIYPNPVVDQFTALIETDQTGKLSLQVYDLTGLLKKEIQLTKPGTAAFTARGNISGLPRGEYVLVARLNDWKRSFRFTKQ